MTWTTFIILCIGLLAAIGAVQSVTLRVTRHVWGRPAVSADAFAAAHFPEGQRATAIKLRELLAPYLPMNIGRLWPTDRLMEDLGLSARLSRGLDLVAFAEDIEAEFKIEFEETDYYEMTTFRDVVNLVERKTAAQSPAPPSPTAT